MLNDVLLDTNVILRLLRADHPLHHAQARRLFEEADKGKLRLIVPMLVVAETVFVLQGFYRVQRAEIAKLIKDLAGSPGVVLLESSVMTRAVEIFGTQGIDFADAYIAALAQETGTTTVATFNKRDFRRFEWLKLVP